MDKGSGLRVIEEACKSSSCIDQTKLEVNKPADSDISSTEPHKFTDIWTADLSSHHMTLLSPAGERGTGSEKEEVTSSVLCITNACVKNVEAAKNMGTPEIVYVMEPHSQVSCGECNSSDDIARNQTLLSNPPSDVPVEWIGMVRHNEGDSLNKMVVQSVSNVKNHDCHQPVKTMKVQTVMGHTPKGGKGSEVMTCMQQCSVEDISSIIRQVDGVSIVIISDNTDWLQQVQSSCVSAENAPVDEINLVVPSDSIMETDATSCKNESHLEPVGDHVLDQWHQGSQPFPEKENNVCTASKHLVLKRPRQPSSSSRESKIPKLITDSEKVESRDLIKAGVSACGVHEQSSDFANSHLQMSAPSLDTEPFSVSWVSTPSPTACSFMQSSPRSLQSKAADFKVQLVRNADNRNDVILPPQPEASHVSFIDLSPAVVAITDAKNQEQQGGSRGQKEPAGPVTDSGTQRATQEEVSDAGTESCEEQIRISGLEVSITNSKGECLGEGGVMYRCTECDYVSSNKHYYKQHVDLVHNTTRPYKCPYCDYAGKRSHALREHLLVHSVQRPFSCTQCNATFRKKGHLTNHTKLHATTPGAAIVAGMSTADTASLIGASYLGKTSASTAFISGPTTNISPARITSSVTPVLSSSTVVLSNTAVENAGAAQGMSSAVASHFLGGSAISEDKASNTSGLWCALCNQAMVDAKTFEMHLQTVHKTDRLYMCETCDYVASDKAGIMSHLPTHLETSTSANDLLPCNASSETQPSTSNITVIYTCAECGFESQTLHMLRTHALKHNAGVPTPVGGQEESGTAEALEQPLQKVVCAVCGLVSDSTDIMRTHMWTHITPGAESVAEEQRTTRPVNQDGSEQLHMALPVSGGNPVQILQDAATAPAGLKVLPHNAAFQCTECSFVSRNASLFIRHMLQHKTQQSQASKAQKVSSPAVSIPTQTGSTEMAIKTTQSYKVRPVTTENTCQNTESSPFVHDEATGRFRCTICGYTCEYQRTIKAHIWKHSGHQQVDYPIFQNGPLSMYDEPAPASLTSISSSPQFSNTTSKPSVVFSSASEHHKPPVVIVTKSNTGITPSPRSLQFVTKDGVPTTAPSGIYKLTPVFQISANNQAPLSASNSNKHIVLRVQSPSADGITASADSDITKAVQQNKSAGELTAACRESGSSINMENVNKEMCGIACRGVSNIDVLTGKASTRTNSTSSESEQLIGRCASPNQEQPDVMFSTANASKLELIKEVSGVDASSKQVIPVRRLSVMPVANQQKTASELPLPTKGCSQGQVTPSKFIYLKVVPEQRRQGTGDKPVFLQGESAVLTTGDEKPLEVEGFFCSSKKTSKLADGCSVQSQQRHQLAGSFPPNVVVEVVPAVSSGAVLTGLQSRSNSPRSLHGMKESPAFEGSRQEEAALTAHPETKRPSSDEIEGGGTGMVKKSKGEFREKDLPDDSRNSLQPRGSSIARAEDSATESPPEAGIQLGQSNKSELAVTLLSLLQKEPNIEPACPQRSLSIEEVPDEAAASQESPSRPPSTMSDTDSASKDTAYGDAGSEDLTSEGESAVLGRGHGRGGRGICSSLLAVIEQLRERSKSESDIEDKAAQSHPPPKKRSSRRRGQRASHDEALVMEDCANIEHLTADDGVAYRCKLCHYTSSRTPLIRLHMRTHRPKEPFECSLCPLVADSNEELQEHMMQHCKARTYPCKFCPQLFNHKSTLRAHMRAHNDADPFLCDLCDFETSSPLEYRAHMQKHSSRALIRCPRCPAILTSRQDLGLHIRSGCHIKGSTRICGSPDGRDDNANSSLGMAVAEETTGSEQLACLRCEFTTHDVRELKEHASSHLVTGSVGSGVGWVEVDNGKEPLQCALCDFTAVSTRSLKSHMKRHANDQRYVQQPLEQYKCSLCGYICHHLPSLKSHMWRHASDANYSYQFTNDVINAAIDYDTRADVSSIPASPVAAADTNDTNGPELLEKVFSAERRIIEGQLSKTTGGARPVCWVTFCCCQCGFETINKAKLNLHMRTHADIINRTLRIGSTKGIDGLIQSHQGETVKCLDPPN